VLLINHGSSPHKASEYFYQPIDLAGEPRYCSRQFGSANTEPERLEPAALCKKPIRYSPLFPVLVRYQDY
jgi:hypothetical protein